MRIYELLEDEVHYYVVSELLTGGELFQHILNNGKFDYQYTAKIIRQVLLALSHMHEQNMAHRDLKPENILMENEDSVKLADFGFAVYLKGQK